MFEVSSISSHTGVQPFKLCGRLPHRRHAGADQTRSCNIQAPHAKVRILIESLYKCNVLGVKKLIRKFSDKSCNFKGLNKLLKKLQDSGSMTRRTGSGRRRSGRSDASLVFTTYSTNIYNQMWLGPCICVCFKFPAVCFCQKLAKSDDIWKDITKIKRVTFFRHCVIPTCWLRIGLRFVTV